MKIYKFSKWINQFFSFSQSIGHISDAHINPAITIGSIVLGKKSLAVGIFYIFAQCAGAIVGYGFLKVC